MAKKTPLNHIEILKKLMSSGLEHSPQVNRPVGNLDDMPTLEERTKFILGIINNKEKSSSNMLFFVMYDIESNKVRYHVVKYLERMGCHRIQKSIFLADIDFEKYETIA